MSTKIYNGYRLLSSRTLANVSRDLTDRAIPVHRDLAVRAVAGVTAMLAAAEQNGNGYDEAIAVTMDAVSSGQLKPDMIRGINVSGPLVTSARIVDKVQKILQGSTAFRVPKAVDLQMSVTFLSDPSDSSQNLALLFTERDEFREVWEATSSVDAYPYWDNTDPPDEVSDDEWSTRRDTWDRAVGHYKAPSLNGITWTFSPGPNALEMATIATIPGSFLTPEAILNSLESSDPAPSPKLLDLVAKRLAT